VLNFTVLSAKKDGSYTEAVTDISAEHITIRSEQTLAEMLRGIQDEAAGRKLKGMPADHAHGKHGKHAHGKHAAPKGDVHHVPSYVAASSSSSSAAAAAASSSNGHGGGSGGGGGSALAPDDGSRTRVYELALDRGISFDAACEILQTIVPEQESAFTSFYIGTHPITNTTMPLLAVKRPNSNYQFQICRPNSRRATVEMSKDTRYTLSYMVRPHPVHLLRAHSPTEQGREGQRAFRFFSLAFGLGPSCNMATALVHAAADHCLISPLQMRQSSTTG